jgi:hypothetical protein
MDDRTMGFMTQLIEKTEQGKLSWSTGFEDGQFKTVLPGGKLAFVVQEDGPTKRFMMLDDNQEVILQENVNEWEFKGDELTVGSKMQQVNSAMNRLIELARTRSLQVNEKLAEAEKLLAGI